MGKPASVQSSPDEGKKGIVHGLRISNFEPTPSPPDDPRGSDVDVSERTSLAVQTTPDRSIPQLVLSGSADPEPSVDTNEDRKLQEAMTDSVLTVHAEPLSRNTSKSSQGSAASKKPRGMSGADLILPIIIYAVVKANPPQLASQLMYLRRYRSAICLTGEASYALVNLTAVVEFLEHVDLAELGLGGDSDKVIR
jgi:hypothetical protein